VVDGSAASLLFLKKKLTARSGFQQLDSSIVVYKEKKYVFIKV